MSIAAPTLTIGIEEEYLLVDRQTRALASEPPPEMMLECEKRIPGLVRPEFLRAQVEIATDVCKDVKQARKQLASLRCTIADIAAKHDLAPIAASTHPFSQWTQQVHTDKKRYNALADDLQVVARRLLISGMHVHIGVEDDNFRIELMNQLSYFLPHLFALSTSSPFWQGSNTGMKSYRLSVFDELPRTGLPPRFDTYAEYLRHVDVIQHVGVIPDASMLWWDLRPSAKFPTLEMRITDVCTSVDDTVAIAALYQCIARFLYRLRHENQRWRVYDNMLICENRWRAQRYGIDKGMIDFGKGEMVAFETLIDELIEMTREDAIALNCIEEVSHIRTILKRGTSAHRQVEVYEASKKDGASEEEALAAVVDWLVEATLDSC